MCDLLTEATTPSDLTRLLKALSQLPDKMNLLGFTDYRQFCREYLDYSENWMMEKLLTA